MLNPSKSKPKDDSWEETLEFHDGATGNSLRLFDRFKSPSLMGVGGIMERFGTKPPKNKAFGRQDIFNKGDIVMFKSVLFEKTVVGEITEDSALVRRSNGKAFYKVAIYKRSRQNPEKRSSKPPILETIDASKMEFKDIWELRVARNTFNKLFMYNKAMGLAKWIYFVHCQWSDEWKHRCATMIQTKWRNYKNNLFAIMQKAMLAETLRKKKAEEERLRKEAEDEKKRIAFEAYVREVGVTPDGIHYFLTRREMNAFLKKQERAIERCKRAFNKIWVEDRRKHLRKRLGKWKEVVAYFRGHKRYDPTEAYTLAHIPEIRRKLLRDFVRHPAYGIKIRPMPSTGTKQRKDGSFRIISLEQFKKFQQSTSGPIDKSAWLIKGRLLCGGLPFGMARRNREGVGGKGTCAAALMSWKLGVYFCLCTKEELKQCGEAGFERDINRKAKDQARVFRNNLRMREERMPVLKKDLEEILYAKKMASLERKPDFDSDIENLHKMMAKAQESIDSAKNTIEKWPEFPEYYYYPIEGGREGMLSIEDTIKLCEHVELKLREGSNVYIFSEEGHGRAGVLGACLLGRLYGYTQDEALRRMQRIHDSRQDMQSRIGKSQRNRMAPIQCPRTKQQRMLIREVLAKNDQIYRDIARCMSPRGKQASLAYKKNVEQSMPPSMGSLGWPAPVPVKHEIFTKPLNNLTGFIYASLRKLKRGFGVPTQEMETRPIWWEVRDKEYNDARKARFLEIEKAAAGAVLSSGSKIGLPPMALPPIDRIAQRKEAERRRKARQAKKAKKGKKGSAKKKKKRKKRKEEKDDDELSTDEDEGPVAGGYLL